VERQTTKKQLYRRFDDERDGRGHAGPAGGPGGGDQPAADEGHAAAVQRDGRDVLQQVRHVLPQQGPGQAGGRLPRALRDQVHEVGQPLRHALRRGADAAAAAADAAAAAAAAAGAVISNTGPGVGSLCRS
jgi:hypothetical protein